MREHVISNRSNWAISLLITGLALFIGVSLVLQPVLAWTALATLVAVFLLRFPPYLIASVSVVVSVFSRLFIAWGIAPGFLTFFHLPLALMAAFVAVLSNARFMARVTKRLLIGIGVFGLISILSWIASGGEFLDLILDWLLFMEPFLVIYAILKTVSKTKSLFLERLALGLVFIQIPFALWQAATLGLGDYVQGTFMRSSGFGGSHELGNLCMMAALMVTAKVLLSGNYKNRDLILIFSFLVVAVLADAKQSIFVYMVAGMSIFSGDIFSRKISLRSIRSIVASIVLISLFLLIWYYYPPLRKVADLSLYEIAIKNKTIPLAIVLRKMFAHPLYFLIGLGPGQSVTRVALLGLEGGYLRSIPSGWGEFRGSELAADALAQINALYPGFVRQNPISTALSGVSSWIGLFGDFGILGFLTYTFLLSGIWKEVSANGGHWGQYVKALIVMGGGLGIVHSWLERPEFTLSWALFIVVSITKTRR